MNALSQIPAELWVVMVAAALLVVACVRLAGKVADDPAYRYTDRHPDYIDVNEEGYIG